MRTKRHYPITFKVPWTKWFRNTVCLKTSKFSSVGASHLPRKAINADLARTFLSLKVGATFYSIFKTPAFEADSFFSSSIVHSWQKQGSNQKLTQYRVLLSEFRVGFDPPTSSAQADSKVEAPADLRITPNVPLIIFGIFWAFCDC